LLWLLNVLFFVLHTALIVFNVFGWAHRKTRKWNLLMLALTLVSWFGAGFIYGVGYCICTDWHWQVREAMGINETAESYIVLLVRTISGWDPPLELADSVAQWAMVFAVVMSVGTNLRDMRKRRQSVMPSESADA
jgi:hypothetical protein